LSGSSAVEVFKCWCFEV